MSSIALLGSQTMADWPCRVCLPYGVDLLQLARWINAAREYQASSQFIIVVGEQSYDWLGLDTIALFSEIQNRCINDSLYHSYVVCRQPRSVIFFDIYGRFSFFGAEMEMVRKLYPFSREIMWENFALLQEQDDIPLREVFQVVQSV